MRKKIIAKINHILQELAEHLPYSVFGVIASIVFIAILDFFALILGAREIFPQASQELFHIFHPVHILLSAAVTTAVFWKHEKKILKAVIIGFFGSILICGLSDIIFPFYGGKLLGLEMNLHICVIDTPVLILSFALIGISLGFIVPKIIEKSTQYSHAVHVLVSSMASILYLLSFGMINWLGQIVAVFIITIISVMIPCCLSDIVFPLVFIDEDAVHKK